MGFEPGDYAAEKEYKLFEDNVESHDFFQSLRGQWRIGPSGMIIGIDYNTIPFMFKMQGIDDVERQRELFYDLQIMENAALCELMGIEDD